RTAGHHPTTKSRVIQSRSLAPRVTPASSTIDPWSPGGRPARRRDSRSESPTSDDPGRVWQHFSTRVCRDESGECILLSSFSRGALLGRLVMAETAKGASFGVWHPWHP